MIITKLNIHNIHNIFKLIEIMLNLELKIADLNRE